MDELSWRARLARKNINILHIDDHRWYYEFMYHPKYGQTKWCKTYLEVTPSLQTPEEISRQLEDEGLSLRKELENN